LYESDAAGTDALAAAMRRAGNVVVAQELIVGKNAYTDSTSLWPLNAQIAGAARAVGLVNLPPPEAADPNARNRAYNNDVQWSKGQFESSFALAGARLLGGRPAGTDPTFLINFTGPIGSFPYYSMKDVLNGDPDFLSSLSGKIVMVGDELSTDKDYFDTPIQSVGDVGANTVQDKMYGIEYNAHALNTILEQNPL